MDKLRSELPSNQATNLLDASIPSTFNAPDMNIFNLNLSQQYQYEKSEHQVASKPFIFADSVTKKAGDVVSPTHDENPGVASSGKETEINNRHSSRRVTVRSENNKAVRRDVIFKIVIRSIKRWYTREFERKTGFYQLPKPKQKTQFRRLLKDFVKDQWQSLAPYLTSSEITFEQVIHYISFLVLPEIWKKTHAAIPYLDAYKAFHNTIYKYSHTRLR